MNSLKIPDHGLMLKGSAPRDVGPLPPQAFAISLSDNVIEGMIKCVQDGEGIQLALGARPTFHYGNKSHRISAPPDSNPYDLYITKPFESTREAYQLPLTMGIFSKPNKFLRQAKAAIKVRTEKVSKPVAKEPVIREPVIREPIIKEPIIREPVEKSTASGTSNSPSLDSDIEALQNGLKRHDEAKGRSVIVAGLPSSRKGANKAKPTFFSSTNANGNHRSLSTSPAPKHIGSPSPNLSAAEQATERAKKQRKNLVHELAVRDRSLDYLKDRWDGADEDFMPTLKKIANPVSSSDNKWTMAKTYWKELDPYMYRYKDDDDRLQVIENAIRQYDKQRLSPSEPQWQLLLPKSERGQGKCLSRLQDKLAKTSAPPPPKPKGQKTDDSSSSKDDLDTGSDNKVKSGGESMSRTSSNPISKPKPSASEAQAKRLLSNTKSKASSSTIASSAVTTPKVAPAKAKITSAPPKANGKQALSQEYVYDSDSSEEHPAAPPKPKAASEIKAKPKPKQASKPVVRPAEKTVERSITAKPRPAAVPMHKAPAKRPRDDDDSSSSSGTPLSKRIKAKAPLPAPSSQLKAQTRDVPSKATKSTSPAKSSPLASSSPTNASDLSEDERPLPSRPPVSKKRKLDEGSAAAPASKRSAVSQDVVNQAYRFKAAYSQYEALHYEIAALDNPPREKLENLNSMRERLMSMKAAIYQAHEGTRG